MRVPEEPEELDPFFAKDIRQHIDIRAAETIKGAYLCSSLIAPRTSDKTPTENMAMRPALRIGSQGDLNANPPRIPLAAKAATMKKTPNETIATPSEAVRARTMVVMRRAIATYSAVLRRAGDLITG